MKNNADRPNLRKNILIVDDTPQNLQLLSSILNSEGYRVRPANSGQVALDAIKTILPDLILLDIMMPTLDGFQVCQELKGDESTCDIPVLFISAIENVADRLRAFEVGGADFIFKPFHPEDVLARVRLHLQLRDNQLLLQQEILAHEALRKELHHQQQELENLVSHRTRELKVTNQQLRKEIELRNKTDQALYESEHRYKSLNEVGFTGTLIHRDRKVVYVNQIMGEILCVPSETLIGMNIFDLLPPETHKLIIDNIQTNKKDILEHDMCYLDGPRIRVESVGFDSHYEGEVARIVAVRDISDKILLRKESERASRLASLGELAAGVAHEINNPNAIIHLNVPIIKKLLEDIWPLLDEASSRDKDLRFAGLKYEEVLGQLPQMLTSIQESSDRISQIVIDLKDFVREQTTRRQDIVDLNEVVWTSSRLMENTIRKATLAFDFQPEASPVLLRGDFQRIEQVVINLIQNACQSLTEMRQSIFMRTYIDKKGQSCLQIRDQGCGISEDNLSKITNPFFTTKRNDGGTGLGLSISSRILQEHDATMAITSVLGQGASFTLCFPPIEENENHE